MEGEKGKQTTRETWLKWEDKRKRESFLFSPQLSSPLVSSSFWDLFCGLEFHLYWTSVSLAWLTYVSLFAYLIFLEEPFFILHGLMITLSYHIPPVPMPSTLLTKMKVLPWCPVVKISSLKAEVAGSTPGQETKISYASWPKKQNIIQKQYYKNSTRTFKKWSTSNRSYKKKSGENVPL